MKAALAIVVCMLNGCAAIARLDPEIGVPYAPLAIETTARAPAYLEASRRALRELGFQIDRAGVEDLEATRPTSDDMRDRARVNVAGDRVEIDVRTELQDSDGTWLRADVVCATYKHVRERELAAAILHALSNPRVTSG